MRYVKCYLKMIEDCRSTKLTLVKTIRYRMKWTEDLLKLYPNLQILYLLRWESLTTVEYFLGHNRVTSFLVLIPICYWNDTFQYGVFCNRNYFDEQYLEASITRGPIWRYEIYNKINFYFSFPWSFKYECSLLCFSCFAACHIALHTPKIRTCRIWRKKCECSQMSILMPASIWYNRLYFVQGAVLCNSAVYLFSDRNLTLCQVSVKIL